MKSYPINLEISGATAMWTRPDTGDAPVSYPIPTWSAAKGIFESVVRLETVKIVPTAVEICSPIIYHNYVTNYGGPSRNSDAVKKGNSYQLIATVLINVCYRLYAEIRPIEHSRILSEKALQQQNRGFNDRHACQEIFKRRLVKGQFYDIPFLGWREFTPSYFGPFRNSIEINASANFKLPSFLFSVFEESGNKRPIFKQGVEIKKGGLRYVE